MMDVNALLNLDVPLVLASGSPRRRQLLEHSGLKFSVVVPTVDEEAVDATMAPTQYVEELARLKALAGAELVTSNAIVLGSDTTVVLGGVVMNKPSNPAHAERMLAELQNRTHTVYTGIALFHKDSQKLLTASSATQVTFRELSAMEISAYVATGSPLDKAGAYGIQDDIGAFFVREIHGCYYTIVGLPLQLLYVSLRGFVAELKGAV
jgi:septum formation protein